MIKSVVYSKKVKSMENFEVTGGKKLSGEVTINSSKNAAVAILMASLINKGKTTLKNVPQIEEINRLLEVLSSIGVKYERKGRTIQITTPAKISIDKINKTAAEKTRSIILLIGSLAGKNTRYFIPQSGGCRLGSRTIKPHLFALEQFGINITAKPRGFLIVRKKLNSAKKIVMYEMGDTATENALLVAAQIPGKTIIKLASANYMVQDLCYFLKTFGVKISGIGTQTLEIEGKTEINENVEYDISEDPIEAMFFITLAASTGSQLTIRRCPIDFLELEMLKLEKMGLRYRIVKEYLARNGKIKLVDIITYPSRFRALEEKIHPLPSASGVNIDNLPFFVPVAMLAKGKTLIHDWVYENRAIYFTELSRLGARINLLDAHRVYVEGPSKLSGTEMMSPPALRPAAIILVAMLAAHGRSLLRNVYSINRGYENLEERLSRLGADIKMVKN